MAEQIRTLSRPILESELQALRAQMEELLKNQSDLFTLHLLIYTRRVLKSITFTAGRDRIKFMSTQAALNLLRLRLLQ